MMIAARAVRVLACDPGALRAVTVQINTRWTTLCVSDGSVPARTCARLRHVRAEKSGLCPASAAYRLIDVGVRVIKIATKIGHELSTASR
jgi:hypothetical protein